MGDQVSHFSLPLECDWSCKCGRYLNYHKVSRPNSEIFLEMVPGQTKHHLKNHHQLQIRKVQF